MSFLKKVESQLAKYVCLLVDDDMDVLAITKHSLTNPRIIIKTYTSGSDAAQRLGQVDFAVIDAGFEGSVELKNGLVQRKIPFISWTGSGVQTPHAFRTIYKPHWSHLKPAVEDLIQFLDAQ